MKLQQRSQDLGHAYEMVKLVTSTLKDIRADLETYHGRWWTECVAMAESVGVQPSMPRSCRSQVKKQHTSRRARRLLQEDSDCPIPG